MTKIFSCEPFSIIQGDALNSLRQLTTKVDCVVTSPPYFMQRKYGNDANELGHEASVGEYLTNLVTIFKAIPLEPWASVWVNIGDKRGKHGELQQIPQQFCLAMRDAGFFLIDHVVWAKESVQVNGEAIGQAMIEPARRRLNGNGHEPFYRFVVNSKAAWSDTCAVHVPRQNVADIRYLPKSMMTCHSSIEGRNLTNVWNMPTGQTPKSHYAVFPAPLVERAVAMTCPLEITAQGPKFRKILMVPYEEARPNKRGIGKYSRPKDEIHSKSGRKDTGRPYDARKPVTIGWEPDLPAIRRGTVLDFFTGAGTVGAVTIKLGRNFVGLELYEEYAQMAEKECREAQQLRSQYEGTAVTGDQCNSETGY